VNLHLFALLFAATPAAVTPATTASPAPAATATAAVAAAPSALAASSAPLPEFTPFPPAECNGSPDHKPCPSATPGPDSITMIDGKAAVNPVAPFAHGETLTYEAEWMGIDVGSATSTVEMTTFRGRPAIHLKASGSSNRTFSLFYRVRDAQESWIDPVGLYSLGFVDDQNQGGTVDKQDFVMDYERAVAHRHRVHTKKDGKLETYDLDIPLTMTHVQDAYSMTYFYRAFALKVGQKLETDVFTDKKIWKLTVEALGKETVKTPAGTFECIKVRPTVTYQGKPENKGEMTIWVTDDDRRIPVKTQATTPFGKVNAVLTKFDQGPKS